MVVPGKKSDAVLCLAAQAAHGQPPNEFRCSRANALCHKLIFVAQILILSNAKHSAARQHKLAPCVRATLLLVLIVLGDHKKGSIPGSIRLPYLVDHVLYFLTESHL